MDTDVLVVGEALIDIVAGDDGADRELVGGSPANVAVGLARQGHATRLLTRIGRDERGRRIATQIEESGARVDERSFTDAPTSTARARLRPDGSAEYEFAIDWAVPAADARDLAGVRAVHTGSIALFLEPGGTAVLDTLRAAAAAGAIVSVDPNIRPALVGDHAGALARFGEAVASADLVKLSDEDARWLYPDLDDEEVLTRIAELGPALVLITRGGEGLLARGAHGVVAAAPYVVTVADTIGAGDAAMASLVSSVLDDPRVLPEAYALETVLRRAAVMAGITVSRAGANPPTRAEVDARLG